MKIGVAKEQMQDWLGDDYGLKTNKAGDKIFVSGDGERKVRFDINNWDHGGATGPHVHFENNDKDAFDQHRFYPQK